MPPSERGGSAKLTGGAYDNVNKNFSSQIRGMHPYRQGYSAVNKAFEYLVHGHLPDKDACIMKNEIKLFENL